MNCPSRVDETLGHQGWNQNPPALAADTTTRQDLNGLVNSTQHRHPGEGSKIDEGRNGADGELEPDADASRKADPNSSGVPPELSAGGGTGAEVARSPSKTNAITPVVTQLAVSTRDDASETDPSRGKRIQKVVRHGWDAAGKYAKFVGPGFMVAVAYMDPGNYSTDVAAGATFRFRLLFVILMSNLFAIFLQSLCIKLGTVTGLNLAENCRAHLPRWLNITLYLFAEAAIIATDMAEVGSGQRAAGRPATRMLMGGRMSGHWLRDRVEPASEDPSLGRLRADPGGRSDYPSLVQSIRLDAPNEGL